MLGVFMNGVSEKRDDSRAVMINALLQIQAMTYGMFVDEDEDWRFDVAVGRMIVHGSKIGLGGEEVAVEILHTIDDVLYRMAPGQLLSTMPAGISVSTASTSPPLSASPPGSPEENKTIIISPKGIIDSNP